MRRLIKTCFTIIAFSLLLAVPAWAQNDATPSDLLVNYFEVSERQDAEGNAALHMDLYFTVLDENGRVMPDAAVNSADILVDGVRYVANVEKPTTPLFIAIALDTSGSMREAAEDMRQGAIDAIENAPDEAQIAIVQFNETINVSGFTSKNLAIDAVRGMQISDRGTCLYDAAHQSVNAVNQAAGNVPVARRAVILFTDGRDERTAGQGDTCSTNTFEQVVQLASRPESPVPIHTIGLGNVDPRLPEMSQVTGGLNARGAAGDLGSAFGEIMNGLRGQLLAQVDMYPSAGRKSATLEVLLRDDVLLTEAIVFESPRDFDPPPLPLNVQRTNLVYDEAADSFQFDVAMAGTVEKIATLQLILVADDGTQVAQYDFPTFAPPFGFRAEGLTQGEDYQIQIFALDADGELLVNERGDALLDSAEFEYRPATAAILPTPTPLPTPAVTVKPIDIDIPNQTMTVETLVENPDQVARYEVQVVNRDSGDLVETISADFGASPTLQLPLSELGEGSYRIIVNAYDASGAIIAESDQEITYTPPAPPGFFARLTSGFAVNPLIPIAIVGILLLLIAFFMVRSLIEKRNTGTPFLQSSGVKNSKPDALPISQTVMLDPSELAGAAGATLMDPRATAGVPKLVLTVTSSLDASKIDQEFAISHYPYSIGRENCDLTLAADPHMSRRHAEITFRDGNFYITDLGSSNGVFVADRRVPANTPTPVPPAKPIGLGKSTKIVLRRR